MTCPSCQAPSHAGERRCLACGGALAPTCLACGASVDEDEVVCASCGTQRVPVADLASEELFQTAEAELSEAVTAPYPLAPRFLEADAADGPLSRLRAALARARERGLVMVAVEGEPGSGKTRLLGELERTAAAGGARCFVAAAAEGDAPFAPVARILAERLGLSLARTSDDTVARIAEVVAEVLPPARHIETTHLLAHLLGASVPGSAVAPPLVDAQQRLEARAFLALKRFLAADASRGPLVLAIDDFHLAGADTLRLTHYLAAGLGASPVLLVTAGRPGIAPIVDDEAVAERIELGPLAPAESERLLAELLRPASAALPPRLAELARALGQTPRSVVELVRWLLETGSLVLRGAGWTLDSGVLAALPTPRDAAELSRLRLGLLPAAERDLLEKAAACGDRFWLDALVALVRAEALAAGDPDGPTLNEIAAHGDRTRVGIALLLAKLGDKGWIVEQPSRVPGAREYRFSHAPLRELVAQGMGAEARVRHHRHIAQWLELRPDGREEDTQEEIGRHLELAGDGDAASTSYRRAGDRARARFFHAKAIRLYARALATASRENLAARIHIWHDVGSVYELKGDFEAALGAFERMLRLTWVASSRSKAAVAFNKLGRVWRRKGDLALALDYLERGRGLFEQAGDERGVAGSLDDIGQALHLLGRNDEAHARINAALARRGRGTDAADKRSIAMSLSNLGAVQKDRGHLSEAEACHRQALELRLEIGDRAGAVVSRANLGSLAFERGDRDGARRSLEMALGDAEKLGAVPLMALALARLGEVATAENKLDEARRRLEEALALGRELDDRRLAAEASRNLGLVELAAGNGARARELSRWALEVAEEAGIRDDAGRALVALATAHASTIYDDDAEASSREIASSLFARAVAVFRDLGNPVELAKTLERSGRFRLEGGDVAGGRALLEEARALFVRLELRAADQVTKILDEL